MTKFILCVPLAVAASAVLFLAGHAQAAEPAGAEAVAAPALSKEEQQKLREHARMRDHINKHVKYPATKQDLVKACKGMTDVKTADKEWFEETLPDRSYESPADVEKALGWEPSPPPAAKTPSTKTKGQKQPAKEGAGANG